MGLYTNHMDPMELVNYTPEVLTWKLKNDGLQMLIFRCHVKLQKVYTLPSKTVMDGNQHVPKGSTFSIVSCSRQLCLLNGLL